jgi:hypothetical protein
MATSNIPPIPNMHDTVLTTLVASRQKKKLGIFFKTIICWVLSGHVVLDNPFDHASV